MFRNYLHLPHSHRFLSAHWQSASREELPSFSAFPHQAHVLSKTVLPAQRPCRLHKQRCVAARLRLSLRQQREEAGLSRRSHHRLPHRHTPSLCRALTPHATPIPDLSAVAATQQGHLLQSL